MIVYNANKGQFVQDVRTNVIATKILDLIRKRGLNAGQDREFAAWQNSMQFMRNIIMVLAMSFLRSRKNIAMNQGNIPIKNNPEVNDITYS